MATTLSTANSLSRESLPGFDPHAHFQELPRLLIEHHNIDPENAFLCPVNGDSMSPTIEHRDIILVDKSDTHPRESRVYMVAINHKHMMVKRVQQIPHGIRLLSDNRIYGSIEVMDADRDNDVTIIGRVAAAFSVQEMLT